MNDSKILEDVYRDFFDSSLVSREVPAVVEEETKNEIDIDKLFITDESKELLKKIINYMEKYNNKEESNYISFNISIESEDKNTIDDISNLLKYYANKYNYVDGKNINNLSLYKLEKPEELIEQYKDNGIIIISDLDAIGINDVNNQKRFFYNLKELIVNKKITIITGKSEAIKTFLQNEDRLQKDYFCFNIKGLSPSVNDVYNELLSKIDMDDEFNIKLLDYISEDYPKSEVDFTTYVNNLYKYISFNKEVPELVRRL